jgi:hypothetical protein
MEAVLLRKTNFAKSSQLKELHNHLSHNLSTQQTCTQQIKNCVFSKIQKLVFLKQFPLRENHAKYSDFFLTLILLIFQKTAETKNPEKSLN